MKNDILSVLQYMEKEKGISREDMIEAIVSVLQTAAQKGVNAGKELKIHVDPKTGNLRVWILYKVVDTLGDANKEIHIDKALSIDDSLKLGDTLEEEIDPSFLGRIAAQAARQGIMQRLRQFEKDRIYDDYKNLIGDIVSGTVRRNEKGDLIVDTGKTEAILPIRERIPGEDYSPGERIRCLLLKIDNTSRGPELVLSRSHPNFIRRLLELEVSEISDGTVTIEGIAREAGYRSKVCVQSSDPKVDPVGACVGSRGARIKTIVRELGGEKIDVVRYFEDPVKLLEEAIKPAVAKNIRLDEKRHKIYFEVPEKDLSIALGRKGQNARLTSALLGWKLDIGKAQREGADFAQKKQRAIAGINQIPGITDEQAQILVNAGITSAEAFEGVTLNDLTGISLTQEQAQDILNKVQIFNQQKTKKE